MSDKSSAAAKTPKLPDWEVYDYDQFETLVEPWYKIIDCHGTDKDSYKFGRVRDHLVSYQKIPFPAKNKNLYSQCEFPLSVGQWFTDALEQKFWKPESQGGLRPWGGLVEYDNNEEMGLSRGMCYGGPGIGGYRLCNFSRRGHPATRPCPMFIQMHDYLLQDVGMYGFFSDLKDWYLGEQRTGIKKPLYPRVKNLGEIPRVSNILRLPQGARLLNEFTNFINPKVKDAWIVMGDYLLIVSYGEGVFNQVELPLASAKWIAKTMDETYIQGQGMDKLQGKVQRFFQTTVVAGEKIRITNGLGQIPLERTRFRLMNLSRSRYGDPLMAQEFDIFLGYYQQNKLSQLLWAL